MLKGKSRDMVMFSLLSTDPQIWLFCELLCTGFMIVCGMLIVSEKWFHQSEKDCLEMNKL
jgi:hypothetical protein